MPKVKVELADVEAAIAYEFCITAFASQFPDGYFPRSMSTEVVDALRRFTTCYIVLKNGFIVSGTNACVHSDTWDPELGKQYARDDALDKVWFLLGYELKTTLMEKQQ